MDQTMDRKLDRFYDCRVSIPVISQWKSLKNPWNTKVICIRSYMSTNLDPRNWGEVQFVFRSTYI